MFGLGAGELLIVLGIVVLLFGATRLPQIGKGLGEGIRNFRGAMREPPQIDSNSESSKPRETPPPGTPH
jgi:sec-independent protein translocase protein TatA